jgi:transposase-like protein
MARGMSTREITGHLRELYGIDVSPDLISTVTDAVLEEVAAWQARPLDQAYPLVFFDAIRVKICDEGMVRNKAIHIALGVMADGTKVVLGLWIEQNEGAKFWLRVMNELKNRGVEDIMLAVVDGLKGFAPGLALRIATSVNGMIALALPASIPPHAGVSLRLAPDTPPFIPPRLCGRA